MNASEYNDQWGDLIDEMHLARREGYNRKAGNLNVFRPLRDKERIKTSEGILTIENRGGYWRAINSKGESLPQLTHVEAMADLCYILNLLEP